MIKISESMSPDQEWNFFVHRLICVALVSNRKEKVQKVSFNNEIDNYVLAISKFIGLVLIVRMINRILLRVIHRWTLKIDDKAISTMLKSISPMFQAAIWCLGFVFYLQNIGVQMAAIWALLSAGGIGAGLALKEPVQEFFIQSDTADNSFSVYEGGEKGNDFFI